MAFDFPAGLPAGLNVHDLPPLDAQAAILSRPPSPERRMADAVRALALDAVEEAGSGHPGMPMGMADAATALWTRALRYDSADPRWPDRDRFVLSNGHGSMLLYALLALTGHAGLGMDELRRFRRLHSPAAGHPEHGLHPAIEATTGPLGQGLACAVGLALAERLMAARFGKSLVDHRTWVLAGDGDLMQGVAHEAASLAGHLRLHKLSVLWDDNRTCADGSTGLSCSDDHLKRFAALGWTVRQVDGHDPADLAAGLALAQRSRKPTLLACRTIIGFAAPTKAGTAESGAAPLGGPEADGAKEALGWTHPPFEFPDDVLALWDAAGHRGAGARRSWLKRLAPHPQRAEFERALSGRLPDGWADGLAALRTELAEARPHAATRDASRRALEGLLPLLPDLVGGSADGAGTSLTFADGIAAVSPGSYGGRYVHFGVREHAMAACMNGMALHGGLIPYGGALLAFSDYMRPALRLAAMMRQRVVHVLTHDSVAVGEDGPTHQPVEQLATLRAVPNLHLFRPADAVETAECWELALRRADGPSVLALSRQAVPALRTDAAENRCARGGYVLVEAEGARRATLVASGSEVSLAMGARALLAADGIPVAVVSLPCWELFALQDCAYQDAVLGTAPRFGIEAACGFGWERWLGAGCAADGSFIGVEGFGASAPAEELLRHLGLVPEAVAAVVRKRLGAMPAAGTEETPGESQ